MSLSNTRRIRLSLVSILPLAVLVLLAVTAAPALAEVGPAEAFAVDFSAVLRLDREGELDLDLAGSVIHSYPHTRIEFVHPVTQEGIVLILDASRFSALILYPDTLNGLEYDYSGKYYADWPGGFASFLSTDPEAAPKDWKKTVGKPAENGVREVQLTSDDFAVDCRIDADATPLSMDVATPDHTASFIFSNYTMLDEADPGLFAVPDGFSLERITTLEGKEQLPL